MKITKIKRVDALSQVITIELPEVEIMQHKESQFEKVAREVYRRTKNLSDFLLWMSEYAKTEEENMYKHIGASSDALTLKAFQDAIKSLKKGKL
jgi:hypothetical protein